MLLKARCCTGYRVKVSEMRFSLNRNACLERSRRLFLIDCSKRLHDRNEVVFCSVLGWTREHLCDRPNLGESAIEGVK